MRTSVLWSKRKLLAGLVMLVILVIMVSSQTISEAFIAFLLGGVVPGTDIILSPEVIMGSVLGFLMLGMVVSLFRLRTRRRLRQYVRREIRIPLAVLTEAIASPAVKQTIPVQTEKIIEPPHTNPVMQRRRLIPKSLPRRLTNIVNMLSRAVILVIRSARKVMLHVLQRMAAGLFLAMSSLKRAAVTITAAAAATGRWIDRSVRSGWRWLEPRLWQLDAWLEIRTRRLIARAHRELTRHNAYRLMLYRGRHMRTSVRTTGQRMSQLAKRRVAELKNRQV